MKKYFWKGIDSSGADRRGFLFAESEEHLKSILMNKQIALLSCKLESKYHFRKIFDLWRNVPLQQRAFFFSQLAVLINSAVEVLKSLRLVSRQIKSKKIRKAIDAVCVDISSGRSLADSMSDFDYIFGPSAIHVVRAGENSGKLGFALDRLAFFLNSRLTLFKKLKQAAILPIITLLFATFIILGIFIFLIPQFESLFASMNQTIPSATKTVINISLFLRSNKFLFLLILLLFVFIFFRIIFQLDLFKRIKDKFLISLPFLGKIFLLYDQVSFLQVLSMFLGAGIPLKEALEFSYLPVKNMTFKEKVILLKDKVVQGQSLHLSMQDFGIKFFSENLIAVVNIGENSGNLDLMLEKASLFMQEELNDKLHLITTALQPILMIVIGILILFLMLSVYLPIFNMANLV